MNKYESDENLEMRIGNLYYYGHDSSVWCKVPLEKGHVIEISYQHFVSKPCWNELCEYSDLIDTVTLDLNRFSLLEDEADHVNVTQFFFLNAETAQKMALRVQVSARSIRNRDMRRIRLEEAGGFHNKEALDQLFKIQRGRCYYSGDPLTKDPKNFVVDHLLSVHSGGTDWPENLALVLKEINTWKGALTSPYSTLKWIAKQRGQSWFRKQRKYCEEVDIMRHELDMKFRRKHKNTS